MSLRDLLKTILLTLLGVWLASAVGYGQTTRRIAWDYPAKTLTQANGFVHVITIDGAVHAATVTCVAGPPVSCSAPLPTLSAGSHVFVVRAAGGGVEESASLTADPSQGPGIVNLKVVITATVTVP